MSFMFLDLLAYNLGLTFTPFPHLNTKMSQLSHFGNSLMFSSHLDGYFGQLVNQFSFVTKCGKWVTYEFVVGLALMSEYSFCRTLRQAQEFYTYVNITF